MKPHNIGNSILPSSSPAILKPMPFRGGVLQVIPDRHDDTHHLTIGLRVIASHPNGFSCHALAERIIKLDGAMEQAQYIIRCGGTADLEAIRRLALVTPQ